MTRVLNYGIVGVLAVALLAGTAYILLNPTQVAGQGPTDGQGQGRGRSKVWEGNAETENGVAAYGQGQGRGNGGSGLEAPAQVADGRSEATQGRGASGGGAFGGAGAFDGSGRNSGAGQGRNETVRNIEWETLTGKVSVVDHEVTIQTAEGQVLIGMGQSAYREGFALEVGDEITVLGFHEDGEFKARTVENLTTGETLTLRDETGRPMWAGQGDLKNQGQRPEIVEE